MEPTRYDKKYSLDGYGFAWGGVFEDINLDGELDLLVAQNYIKWPPHKLNKLPAKAFLSLVENGTQGFYHSDELGLNNPYYGQTSLIADLNADGKLDVIWLNIDGPVRAFLNQSDNNFLKLTIPDTAEFLGMNVVLEFEGGSNSYTRQVMANVGMGSDQTPNLFFGLGKRDAIKALHIVRPDGSSTIIENPAINSTIELR